MIDRDLSVLVELTWAAGGAAFAEVLRALEPSWESSAHPFAGGQLVLSGRGMYVNRAVGSGLTQVVEEAALDEMEARCRTLGVPPAVEVTDVTLSDVVELLERRRYRPDETRLSAVARPLEPADADEARRDDGPPGEAIEIVTIGPERIWLWQDTAAIAWGHADGEPRRVSDAYALAASKVDGETMLLAIDARDGHPLATATLSVRGTVATLGGMATIPAARRRGVQSALIRRRVSLAAQAGCTHAVSSAVLDGPSERNLLRQGFERIHAKQTWTSSRPE